MNPKRIPLLLAIVLFSALNFPSHLSAKGSTPIEFVPLRPQLLIGPAFQINRNYHSGGFGTLNEASCPLFEDGSGMGWGIGLSAEFSPIVEGSWSLIPRVMFEQRPGQFHQELPNTPVLSPSSTAGAPPEIVNQTVTTTSEITYTLLNAELTYKHDVVIRNGFRLGLAIGPAVGYVISATNRQVQDLEEPLNARFVNNEGYPTARSGRRLIFFDDDIPQRNSTRFSIKGGIQTETGLFGNQWMMSTGIFYDYGVTNVARTESWKVSSIIFQVDFRRGL